MASLYLTHNIQITMWCWHMKFIHSMIRTKDMDKQMRPRDVFLYHQFIYKTPWYCWWFYAKTNILLNYDASSFMTTGLASCYVCTAIYGFASKWLISKRKFRYLTIWSKIVKFSLNFNFNLSLADLAITFVQLGPNLSWSLGTKVTTKLTV